MMHNRYELVSEEDKLEFKQLLEAPILPDPDEVALLEGAHQVTVIDFYCSLASVSPPGLALARPV